VYHKRGASSLDASSLDAPLRGEFNLEAQRRADIDFCLQSLMLDRFVLVDGRYSCIHTRFAGSGGNARQRSAERHEQEIRYLKRKWGPYLDVAQAKGTTRLVVRVVR
jgi:hypothetical protein